MSVVVQGDMFGSHWVAAAPLPVKYAVANLESHAIFAITRHTIKKENGKYKLAKVKDLVEGDEAFDAIRQQSYKFNDLLDAATNGGEFEIKGTHSDTVEASYGLMRHLNELNADDSPLLVKNKIKAALEKNIERAFPVVPATNMADTYDVATSDDLMVAGRPDTTGGIDLSRARMNLQIKRDENGVPLPLNMQPIENINIEGLQPVIINITPVTNLPMLLGLTREKLDKELSSLEGFEYSEEEYFASSGR